MSFDWWIVLALWVWALALVLGPARRVNRVWGGLVIAAGLGFLGVATFASLRSERTVTASEVFAKALPREGRPGGYVTSDQCRACHPSQYETWHQTYHRTMTQWARPGTVVAPFAGVTLPWQGKHLELVRAGDQFQAHLPVETARPGIVSAPLAQDTVDEQIGMLTGSHHMQVYWVPTRRGNLQSIFPYAYLIADRRWVPFMDTFLRDPRLPPDNQAWNRNCINCHAVAGQPRADLQAGTTDTQVGELGIACEACHGPGEAHVATNGNPWHRYRAHLSGEAQTTIVNPKRLSSKRASQVCGRCHSIKWSPDATQLNSSGYSYRPGDDLDQTVTVVRPAKLDRLPQLRKPLAEDPHFLEDRFWTDGIVRVSGRDYSGMIESGCYQRGELSCLSCHQMHGSHPVNQLAAGMESNSACLQCHPALGKDLEAHTHHSPASTGSLCYNCHMPYTTYGLLKAIRNHYIDSPNVATLLKVGRPNACNLCHLARTSQWTANYLHDWYQQPGLELSGDDREISAAALLALRGEAGQRALVAWSMGWGPAQQVSGTRWLVPYLAQLLDDPYAAVRYIARRSLESIPGSEPANYDFVGPPEQRTRCAQQILDAWQRNGVPAPTNGAAEVLLEPSGRLAGDRFARLLKGRDDRSMNLQE